MRPVDLHPEDLLVEPSAGEERRRRQHLEACVSCEFERLAHGDIQAFHIDRAELMPLVDEVMESVPMRSVARPRRGNIVAVAAAAVLACSSVALATWSLTRETDSSPSGEHTDRRVPHRQARERTAPKDVVAPLREAPHQIVLPVRPHRRASVATRSAPTTAAELFDEAATARSRGVYAEALTAYERLFALYPNSREARNARVGAENVLLYRLARPREAASMFEAYLSADRQGVLAEEARVGRAIAAQRMGHQQSERMAWEDLLAKHPATPHALRAQKRLEELR